MRNETFSVYNEGVTWVVGLSAAAAGGAFLHYDALSSATPYVRALFFVVVGCFLGTVGVGVQYAFWLHYARNEQDRKQQLREREKPETDTADALDDYRELQAIANHIEEAREHVTSYHQYMHWLFSSGLIGAAILFGLALIPGRQAQTEGGGSTKECCKAMANLSDQLAKVLIGRITNGSAPPTGTQPSTEVKLDPQLEQALWQHVQKPAPTTSGTPWILLAVVGVIVAGALIALVSMTKPEASTLSVAVTIFGAVTTFIVKLAAQKPHLPSQVPWWIITVSVTATGAGALLIVAGLIKFLKGRMAVPAAAPLAPEDQRKEKTRRGLEAASLLVYGLSAILVALVPAMVFIGDDGKKTCPDCSQAAVMSGGDLSVSRLNPITDLGDGDEIVDSARIQALMSNATSTGMKSGDILLLLGSADCRAVKKGGRWSNNEALAAARADSAKHGLDGKPELSGVRVQAKPLPQHIGCRPSPDVRAVYPFLIQSKPVPPKS
jgi:hypothetical protein